MWEKLLIATHWTNWGCNTGRAKRSFTSLNPPDWLWDPATLQFNGYRDYFPVVKRRRHVLLWLRMSGALPHPTVCAYMACTGTPFYLEKYDSGSAGEIHSRSLIHGAYTGHGDVWAVRLTTWKYRGSTWVVHRDRSAWLYVQLIGSSSNHRSSSSNSDNPTLEAEWQS